MDEVTWTKSGTSLSGDSEGDVVSLHSVQAEDSGEYCCEGVGGGGVRSDCVNLRVEGERASERAVLHGFDWNVTVC